MVDNELRAELHNCWDDYGNLKEDALEIAYEQGGTDAIEEFVDKLNEKKFKLQTSDAYLVFMGDVRMCANQMKGINK